MKFHDVASIFPMMGEDELENLAEDIKTNGLIDAIWTYKGEIIDGRNRYLACQRVGETPRYQEWDGGSYEQLVAFVVALNLKRRHLTSSQRAMIATDIEERLAEAAKERMSAGGKVTTKQGKEKIPYPVQDQGQARDQAAEIAGTNPRYVQDAKKIKEEAPELVHEVESGKISIPGAMRKIKQQKREEKKKKAAESLGVYRPMIFKGDAIPWLESQKKCDLLITDPPYMTDIEDIGQFANSWLPRALSRVKRTGRAYICIGPYPQELNAYLSVEVPKHLVLSNVLVWTYRNTLGPSPKMAYKNNWQAILYYYGVDAQPLNCPIMIEQFTVQDISAPDGRQGDRYHVWQKPDKLAIRLISHSTKKDDLVLDPFCGTGTFLLAAANLSRIARGCDVNEDILKIAKERGCNYG